MPATAMKHDADPAAEIWDSVGSLDGVTLMHNQILIGIYVRPNVTKSGIFLTDKTVDEDLFQGKVGLVLKKGPTAFKDDPNIYANFHGQDVEPGDWIVFRPSDGWSMSVNRTPCRVLQDVHIKARVTSPDVIW